MVILTVGDFYGFIPKVDINLLFAYYTTIRESILTSKKKYVTFAMLCAIVLDAFHE